MASTSLQHRLHKSSLSPKYPRISRVLSSPSFRFSSVRFPSTISFAAPEPAVQSSELKQQKNDPINDGVFACPVCYEPLIRKGPSGFNLPAIYRSGFECKKCNKPYSSKENYLDLTITACMKDYNEFNPIRSELFRSPVVSFLYERGWRQNFNLSGFPGPDEEFQMAQEYFKPAQNGLLVDVSCGSGLFSRKFVESGNFSKVVALDFSESMLRQCNEIIKQDDTMSDKNIAIVRADVSRLPFTSGSVDAVYAGAAIHCWPSPSNAMAEISRVMKSGGVFVGTTFLRNAAKTSLMGQIFREMFMRDFNCYTEGEIEDLCTSCGLTNYQSTVQDSFIMFAAERSSEKIM